MKFQKSLMLAGALALGLANGFPITLSRPDVWEVPIFCGYALTMLTLGLLWRALLRLRGGRPPRSSMPRTKWRSTAFLRARWPSMPSRA